MRVSDHVGYMRGTSCGPAPYGIQRYCLRRWSSCCTWAFVFCFVSVSAMSGQPTQASPTQHAAGGDEKQMERGA